MKKCSKCKEDKPLDRFSKHKTNKDGLQYECKDCVDKYNVEYRATHKVEAAEYDAEYNQTPAGRATQQRKDAKQRIKFPEKIKARKAVYVAVRAGRLTKPAECSVTDCTTARIEAHHYAGYEEEHWLEVVWLCILHHREADKLEEVSSSIDIAGEGA